MTTPTPSYGTATIIPTRKLVKVVFGRKTYDLPEGTTDAGREWHALINASQYTWVYAGPVDASVVVVTRIAWTESITDACKRCEQLAKKFGYEPPAPPALFSDVTAFTAS